MRNFINLKKQKQIELEHQFPCIRQLFTASQQSMYSLISISVFDHHLTPEEAKLMIIDNGDSYNFQHDKKLHSFGISLSESTIVHPIKRCGRYKTKFLFRSLTSTESAATYFKPKPYHHSDLDRFFLALPIYDAIYFEGCDYTHHLYYKNFEKLDPILKLAKAHGLHILKSRITPLINPPYNT